MFSFYPSGSVLMLVSVPYVQRVSVTNGETDRSHALSDQATCVALSVGTNVLCKT